MGAIFKREFKSHFQHVRGFLPVGVLFALAVIWYVFNSLFGDSTFPGYEIANVIFILLPVIGFITAQCYSKEIMGGYAFVSAMVLSTNIFVTLYCFFYGMPSISYALSDMTLVSALIIPAIASGVISSERQNGTDRLLSMLPISRAGIVVGKYLALLCVFLIPVALCGFFPLWLDLVGEVNFAASYAGLFCYAIYGAALIAISVFCSALFDKVWVGMLVNYGALMVVYLANTLARTWLPIGRMRDILLSLSFFGRFDGFVHGIFDLGAVIFYAAVALIFLFLSVYAAEKRRLF